MKLLNNKSGFTLVELMVVVGIIGILSAVAIPQFQTYQAKSKTSEAKIQLAAIYSAEISLMSDYDSYATCLQFAGYAGPGTNNYYAVGFNAANTTTNQRVDNNAGGVVNCNANPGNTRRWAANKSVGGYTASAGNIPNGGATGTIMANDGASFRAGALGGISASNNNTATASYWTIDQDKNLVEQRRGY